MGHCKWLDVFRKKADGNFEEKRLDFVNVCLYFSICDCISFLMDQEFKESEFQSFLMDLDVLAELGCNSGITLIWEEVVPEFVPKTLQSDGNSRWSILIEQDQVTLKMNDIGDPNPESKELQSRIEKIMHILSVVD